MSVLFLLYHSLTANINTNSNQMSTVISFNITGMNAYMILPLYSQEVKERMNQTVQQDKASKTSQML